MASAALKEEPDTGTDIPGEGEDGEEGSQTTVRDFEAEAREHGWRPKDEFPGDPTKWVDAEAFMKRADEVMPLLKAQNTRLKRDFDALRKDLRRATAHFEGAEKRAFEKAKSELEERIEAAIETGDLEAGKAALKEIGELKPTGDQAQPKYTEKEAYEALDQFREDNPWFDRANLGGASDVEINARAMFDRIVEKRSREMVRGDEPPPEEFFAGCAEEVLAKYPALKGKPPRQKPSSAVEGGRPGGQRGSTKTWDNLPEPARRQYERFISRGIGVKSTGDAEKDQAAARAYYAKTHDWEGYVQ